MCRLIGKFGIWSGDRSNFHIKQAYIGVIQLNRDNRLCTVLFLLPYFSFLRDLQRH